LNQRAFARWHAFGVRLALHQDSHRHAAVRGIRRVLKMHCIFK
jgi:hypothetical protein